MRAPELRSRLAVGIAAAGVAVATVVSAVALVFGTPSGDVTPVSPATVQHEIDR